MQKSILSTGRHKYIHKVNAATLSLISLGVGSTHLRGHSVGQGGNHHSSYFQVNIKLLSSLIFTAGWRQQQLVSAVVTQTMCGEEYVKTVAITTS